MLLAVMGSGTSALQTCGTAQQFNKLRCAPVQQALFSHALQHHRSKMARHTENPTFCRFRGFSVAKPEGALHPDYPASKKQQ